MGEGKVYYEHLLEKPHALQTRTDKKNTAKSYDDIVQKQYQFRLFSFIFLWMCCTRIELINRGDTELLFRCYLKLSF